MTRWWPEHADGHLPFCAHPAHPPGEWCAACPEDLPTMLGEPSRGWLADHDAASYWFVCRACGAVDWDTRYKAQADDPLPCQCGASMIRVDLVAGEV